MKVTVTQMNAGRLQDDWAALTANVRAQSSEFVLLPEMCFAPWFCAAPSADVNRWNDAVNAHDRWLGRLPELGATVIIGTAPRNVGVRKHNVATSGQQKLVCAGITKRPIFPTTTDTGKPIGTIALRLISVRLALTEWSSA